MYMIAAIGLLTIALSLLMIASPGGWARGILLFAAKPYFHAAEILSRLVLGGTLVAFAGDTLHPRLMGAVGYVLVAVAVGLLCMGSRRHRAFAEKSASFDKVFRPAGFFSLAFGVFVVLSALGTHPNTPWR
jgi:hypothetical protein